VDIINNQLRSIVGPDNIITDPEGLAPYSQGNISFIPDRSPLMAVRPGTVEEIKSILRVARTNKIPVTPFSSSKNGHGSSIPSVPGITIDLRRLNAIAKIDEPSRMAEVGPGVTFEQLQKAAGEKGLRVIVPLELPADSSVLSTYLEMTPLYGWPRYGTEFILTQDLLLASGETVQTGSNVQPLLNDGVYVPLMTVPSIMERAWFGAQGTYGISTKASVKLKTVHEANEVIFISGKSFMELLPVIKKIKAFGYPVEFFAANAAYLASMFAENNDMFEELKTRLPAATAVMILRGQKGEVDYQKADIEDAAKEMNLALSYTMEQVADAPKKILDELDFPKGYTRAQSFRGAYNVIPFICMASQLPMFDMVVNQFAGAFKFDRKNIGELMLPVEATVFHYQYSFYSNPAVPPEHMVVKKLFEMLSGMLIKMGGFFSRPYGEWATQVYNKANQYKELLKEYKAVLDPENIMNPGKLDF